MKVILRETVPGLGEAGKIVKVADGYGRNYLIPKNIATLASEDNVKQLEHEKKQIFYKQAKEKREALKFAEELKTVSITVSRQVGEEEKIFGSVTSRDIAELLREEGYKINRRQISLDENIKTTGTYEAQVKLHTEVSCPIKVWVVKQED